MNTCCNNIYPDEDMNRWESCPSTMLANVDNFYTKDEIDDIIEEIEISGGSVEYSAGTGIDITDHVISCTVTGSGISSGDVQNMIDESISGKADTSAVTAVSDALTAHTANTTVHVTSQDKENWGNKLDASALNGYATQEWVENKGYLTEHQPIKTINGISMVGTGDIEIGSGGTTDLSNYYNKQEVNAIVSGKAETSSVTAVNNALTAHTSNGDIHVTSQEKSAWNAKLDASAYTPCDLSDYYTKEQTDSKLDRKLETSAYTPTDLSDYWTSAQTSSAINQAVSGKAETTAVTAHTSDTTIHVTSSDKSNWNTAYNNYFDKNNIWCGTESEFNTATQSGTSINPNIIYFIK